MKPLSKHPFLTLFIVPIFYFALCQKTKTPGLVAVEIERLSAKSGTKPVD
jgi:hypothetical protein